MSGHDLLFPKLPYHFTSRAPQATNNEALQQALHHATLLKEQKRRDAFARDFGLRTQALRDLAASIKQHTLDHLDFYLEQFIDRAQAAGVTIHFAAEDQQACAIVADIVRQHDCKLCVKAKSMVTEEIQLLPALEAAGCQTIETDLAEFILQIDDDAPSHIVTAMIHKDRKAAGRAMHKALGVPYEEDPEKLTAIARAYLRDQYRRADLGVSGGNFLVAETGTLVLCTNEGNGRMCSSVPPVHVAVVGIEKLVPAMQHLGVMLKVLARSSTAQPLTVYTHMITGPRKAEDHDGPREMHIVLLDHGRAGLLHESTREMLRCIRCGACLNTCPVYRKAGGHAYGSVYSGPIGAILTPHLQGLEDYPDLAQASSLCGACYEVCPVKINIPHFLTLLRAQAVSRGLTGWSERAVFHVWSLSLRYPWMYRWVTFFQRMILRGMARREGTLPEGGNQGDEKYTDRGWCSSVPGPLAGWGRTRDLPSPPSRDFRSWWSRRDV